jgi:selenium metabolism protein YedF
MEQANLVVTLVDNETARTNVSRMAKKAGWQVDVASEGDDFRISLTQGDAEPQSEPVVVGSAELLNGPIVLVVSSDVMGRGDAELGGILVRSFFHTLGEIEPLPRTILFLNSGVKLACEGSRVLDDLCALAEQGIEMLVCGTCLGFYELTDKLDAGQVSNMYDIAEAMLGAGKVVNL